MGFSVSGATAIVFLGALLAFGIMFPAAIDSTQQLGEAQAGHSDRVLEQQNTAIAINETTYDDGGDLIVTVDNEGATTLVVDETDFLLEGDYAVPDSTVVAERTDSNVWAPGETLEATFDGGSVDRVKVVTGSGVADLVEGLEEAEG